MMKMPTICLNVTCRIAYIGAFNIVQVVDVLGTLKSLQNIPVSPLTISDELSLCAVYIRCFHIKLYIMLTLHSCFVCIVAKYIFPSGTFVFVFYSHYHQMVVLYILLLISNKPL
ncbi:hypothetical protein DPEC_G00117100 [Dallia pectoralis]|uniref:Uncharacterized protein n=1 Tax=Dallia pectoralis TaxID=75939 RepID=A0ACC2GUK5_DALPE|nr:hypothetical protein DPEC_G00117100 [Dallia pectoralis]